MPPIVPRLLSAGLVVGSAALAWGLAEAHAFTVRRVSVPVLPRGSQPIRVLHLSDLHLTPSQRDKIAWVRDLANEPVDLVVTTGDNLGHEHAVAPLLAAYAPLTGVPGVFVFGSNDYHGPLPKSPFLYFGGPSSVHARARELPTEDLRRGLADAGWLDLNNARATLTLRDSVVSFVGLDDPHIGRDNLPEPTADTGDLRVGVVHAPYLRALGALRDDGARLILAGHTHGGQVCLPGYGTLVTNCDLDRRRARGLHAWPDGAEDTWLHVSAGLGTSPYAPVRVACRPEATILTLVPA